MELVIVIPIHKECSSELKQGNTISKKQRLPKRCLKVDFGITPVSQSSIVVLSV